MAQKTNEAQLRELYNLFAKIDNPQDFELLLGDLCTFKEIEQMASRIAAAKLFLEGKTYIQVMKETNISSATLSRISRCVQHGKGYKKLLKSEEEK